MEGHTILIVEDDEQIRSALVKEFTRVGFSVVEARDGKEGLACALRDHPDLIVLDIMMPVMNGIEMAKQLRADTWGKNAHVLILTNLKTELKAVREVFGDAAPPYLIKADTSLQDVVAQAKSLLGL